MKKKMKNKQRSRHEESSKFNYLPPSPPPQQKSPQDSHYQSSSSPVGRPPPVLYDNMDEMISDSDNHLLQDLKAFLAASNHASGQEQPEQQEQGSLLLPSFIQEQQLDVHLYGDDDNNSIMSFDEDVDGMDFFHALPPPS